ncbi:hypothetical protein GCM10020220_105110 [Nonomuraea rubra]
MAAEDQVSDAGESVAVQGGRLQDASDGVGQARSHRQRPEHAGDRDRSSCSDQPYSGSHLSPVTIIHWGAGCPRRSVPVGGGRDAAAAHSGPGYSEEKAASKAAAGGVMALSERM